tara:strand:+ start:4654 stop:4797 length:144 start_codon:yes stop_codon:yes gene_type:complete
MPLPVRKKGTDRDSFISSCVRDSVMRQEYPDFKQRMAVCSQQANDIT